ncbi:hypothetical protein SK128_009117 [Halocaridina rubra]|uniref:Midnolin n=1 Tax=Halocaridina rubra TaxID=373956 RepID=A0AAN9A9U1_HALRR
MHHHGKGVYSGTFSGTLNPALQDRQGRPKRDISTIIHILNDLLCATPQYRRHSSTTISVSTSSPSSRTKSSINSKRPSQNPHTIGTNSSHQEHSNESFINKHNSDGIHSSEQDSGDENQAMRTKVEQLRLIMEQRRARRKARRDARAQPYPHNAASWATNSSVPTVVTTTSTATTAASQSMEVDANDADGVDPATLCELNSETVVA